MSRGPRRPGLRRARKDRGWGLETAVDRAHRKLAEYRSPVTGDAIPAELLGLDVRQLQRWENGETTPRPLSVWLLSRTYGRPPGDLDLPSLDDLETKLEHEAAPDAGAGKITGVERRDFVKGLGALALSSDQLAGIVTSIAHESRAHVARTELSNVGPAALEQLTADVGRLSRALVSKPILPVFTELVNTRDGIYALLDGHQSPRQTADLYFLAGQTCGLLANASLDLGQNAAAAEHARSAWAYGEMIGDGALCAFGRATQSLIAYWSGAYGEAVSYAQAGLMLTDSPNVRARLLALEARARAKLGAVGDVVRLVDGASEAVERADPWSASGGHLEFTRAKLLYYATNAYADIGRHEDAIVHGERSIRLYQATPTDARSYGDEAGCYVALAEVSVRHGAIDGASSRLAPVLAHPQTGQIQLLRTMLGGLRRQLANPAVLGADSRALVERLDSF
jgi:tetratricopeptide (TPR) repeat protein